jgi:hypothetical protein
MLWVEVRGLPVETFEAPVAELGQTPKFFPTACNDFDRPAVFLLQPIKPYDKSLSILY